MTDRENVIKGLECCTKKVCIYKDTEKECPYLEMCDEYFEDCTTALAKDTIALLKAQEPRVHGRWIDENPDDSLDPRMRCSICTGVESPLLKWRYCPNCGARMDGERRGDNG